MCKALIIGAGGVGTVVTQKIAANPVFTDVMLASRTKSKCDAVAAAIGGGRVKTAQVDADNVPNCANSSARSVPTSWSTWPCLIRT